MNEAIWGFIGAIIGGVIGGAAAIVASAYTSKATARAQEAQWQRQLAAERQSMVSTTLAQARAQVERLRVHVFLEPPSSTDELSVYGPARMDAWYRLLPEVYRIENLRPEAEGSVAVLVESVMAMFSALYELLRVHREEPGADEKKAAELSRIAERTALEALAELRAMFQLPGP